jgi:hypothetical protein
MKKCSNCGIEKPLIEFHKCKPNKDGYHYQCKVCRKEYSQRPEVKKTISTRMKKYRQTPERIEAEQKWKEDNKQTLREKSRIYRTENAEIIKEKRSTLEYKQKAKEYRLENKQKYKKQKKLYYSNNKEHFKQRTRQNYKKRVSKEPACIYQIKCLVNKSVYIGETMVGTLRWTDHLSSLRGNYHKNSNLQKDFNEHGEEAFEWSIIKELPKDKKILLLEEAREIQRRIIDGEDLYNLMLTIEQLKMLNENQELK